MSIIKKSSAIAIVILVCVSLLSFNFTNAKTNSQDTHNKPPAGALIVPDNYPTLEEAVNDAAAGGTVFVRKGMYHVDGLEISKPLNLIGEEANKTILNANADINSGQETVIVSSSNVLIKGFTITRSHEAIVTRGSHKISGIVISQNVILNNSFGIGCHPETIVSITENVISNNQYGISLSSTDSIISNNTITNNYRGIDVFGANNLTIADNNIVDNSYGIYLGSSWKVNIYDNNITGSIGYDNIASMYKFGLGFRENCNNTLIHDNNILQNSIGINLQNFLVEGSTPNIRNPQGTDNMVYQNNIANNGIHNANVEHSYPYNATGIVNGTGIVSWDNGTTGNYWGDYQSKYLNVTEIDSSGIGNTAYTIDEVNIDHYPLMRQVSIASKDSDNQPQGAPLQYYPIAITVSTLIAVAIIVLIMRKKRITTHGQS